MGWFIPRLAERIYKLCTRITCRLYGVVLPLWCQLARQLPLKMCDGFWTWSSCYWGNFCVRGLAVTFSWHLVGAKTPGTPHVSRNFGSTRYLSCGMPTPVAPHGCMRWESFPEKNLASIISTNILFGRCENYALVMEPDSRKVHLPHVKGWLRTVQTGSRLARLGRD